MKLYKFNCSAASRNVLMSLDLMKITDVEFIEVNMGKRENMTEEMLKLNPQHTIPILVDGDLVLCESHAIVVYVLTKYRKDLVETLYPSDPAKRALVDQRIHFDNGILFPTFIGSVVPLYKGKATIEEAKVKVETAFDFMNKFLTGKEWLALDHMTIADIFCASTVGSILYFPIQIVDVTKYPNLAAWFDRMSKKDFFINEGEPSLKRFTKYVQDNLDALVNDS